MSVRTFTFNVVAQPTSALAAAAAQLGAGQSIRLTTPLTGSDTLVGGELSSMLQWGASAYYDPIRNEVGYIGKIADETKPYHWLVYNVAANTWSNSRLPWSAAGSSGHGYDHNACDPATGTVYHRPYFSKTVQAWNGTSWSALPAWTQNSSVVGGLTYFPGVGLFYNDGRWLLRWNGSAWSATALGGDSYHDFSEYNETANVMIFGGGNASPYRKITAAAPATPVSIASPVTALGIAVGGAYDQSLGVSDPNSAALYVYERTGSFRWAKYDINADTWSLVTKSTGDGSAAQNGAPNLSANNNHWTVATPIPASALGLAYGVIMVIQFVGSGTAAPVWLYRP